MKKEYIPEEIEVYVQEYWKKNKTFQVFENTKKEKYYCLPMLPYPSGKLHMGHVRNYTISDVIARYQRMLGKNVLQPIGWDAFGLPAEEAAIKNKTTPSEWTYKNIKYMKKQLQSLGFSYDWNREITTCKPEYYRWEQWFFTKLFEKKLVYKKNSIVNWCPYDQTVLANEQVIKGCCWRCQSNVQTKEISQWFIKIRNYAEILYQDLKKLDHWPKQVKNMQKNWIGRSKGFEITLNIFNSVNTIKVFINRLDIIMGATYILISSCHKIAVNISKKNKKIKQFIEKNKYILYDEQEILKYTGINTNIFGIHPLTKQQIPIWIGNFIIKEYGTNAILSVPGHNKNDWNFAIKHCLKIKYVILNSYNVPCKLNTEYIDKKGVLCNSKEFDNLNFKDSTQLIYKNLCQKNIIKKKIIYKLQDWCVSRQRYWGAPIPMATLEDGKIVKVPENTLPVLLPKIENNSDSFQNTINPNSQWAKININEKNAIRETDTFDTFIESSWYYARYTCPNFNKGMIDPKKSKYWLPVDQYIGGIEHAIMHLMYFRFFHKLLRDFRLVDFDEPVKQLLCQGMVLADAFYEVGDDSQRNWINSSSVSVERNIKGEITKSFNHEGKEVIYAGMIKMSKSKNNGIEPELMIKRYGADTIRLFIMFSAPVESSLEWKESGVKGMYRFLKKLWNLIFDYIQTNNTYEDIKLNALNAKQMELYDLLNKTIAKVSDDIDRRKSYNTAISSIMKLVNELIKTPIQEDQDKSIMKECLICIVKMLYPFTPHFCFIVWNHLYKKKSIDYEKWPICKKNILLKTLKNIIIQINGKTKCVIKISNDLNQEEIFLYAKSYPLIQNKLKNMNINKIIYIPNKIINFLI